MILLRHGQRFTLRRYADVDDRTSRHDARFIARTLDAQQERCCVALFNARDRAWRQAQLAYVLRWIHAEAERVRSARIENAADSPPGFCGTECASGDEPGAHSFTPRSGR